MISELGIIPVILLCLVMAQIFTLMGCGILALFGKKTGKVAKPCAKLLPFTIVGFGVSCAICGMMKTLPKEDWDMLPLFIGVLLIVVVGMLLFFYMPVLMVKGASKHINKRILETNMRAMDIQEKHEQNEADKLLIEKQKYRLIKCEYCGTYNKFTDSNCKNCGATLKKM